VAEVHRFPGYFDVRSEASLVRTYPEESALIIAPRSLEILLIGRVINDTQIDGAIVVPDAVLVVDLILRPLTSHPQPRETMGGILFAEQRDPDIPLRVLRSGFVTDANASPCHLPSKYAARRVVTQKRAKSFRRQHFYPSRFYQTQKGATDERLFPGPAH